MYISFQQFLSLVDIKLLAHLLLLGQTPLHTLTHTGRYNDVAFKNSITLLLCFVYTLTSNRRTQHRCEHQIIRFRVTLTEHRRALTGKVSDNVLPRTPSTGQRLKHGSTDKYGHLLCLLALTVLLGSVQNNYEKGIINTVFVRPKLLPQTSMLFEHCRV